MSDPGLLDSGPWRPSGRNVITLVVLLAMVLGLAATCDALTRSLGEGGSGPEVTGGSATGATASCRAFIRAHTHQLPLRFEDVAVRHERGWWVVSASAVIGKRADEAREPFVCHVTHDENGEWASVSLCPAPGSAKSGRHFLKARDSGCDQDILHSENPTSPAPHGY